MMMLMNAAVTRHRDRQTNAQQRIAQGLAHHFATGSSLVGPGTVEPYRSSRRRPQEVWVGENGSVSVGVIACV